MNPEVQRALSILNEAKNQGIISQEIPNDDSTKVVLADTIVSEAQKAHDKGQKSDKIMRILFAAEVTFEDKDKDTVRFEQLLGQELEGGIPIPDDIEGDPPNIPIDIPSLSTKEQRFLHGAFNAVSARVGWLYAQEEAAQKAAKIVADEHEERYIIHADRKDYGGKAKAAALLKAEARDNDPQLVKWRDEEKKHEIAAGKYYRLLEIYNNCCDRISRQWTMAQDEKEHS